MKEEERERGKSGKERREQREEAITIRNSPARGGEGDVVEVKHGALLAL